MDALFQWLEYTMTDTATDMSTRSDPVLERRAITFKNQKRVLCKQDQVVLWLQEFYTIPGNLEKLLSIE
jgi:hypothetical protein